MDFLISVLRHDGAQELGHSARTDEVSGVLENLRPKQFTLVTWGSSIASAPTLPLQALHASLCQQACCAANMRYL